MRLTWIALLALLAMTSWLLFNYRESVMDIGILSGKIEYMHSLDIPYVYDAEKLDLYCYGEGWKKENEVFIEADFGY